MPSALVRLGRMVKLAVNIKSMLVAAVLATCNPEVSVSVVGIEVTSWQVRCDEIEVKFVARSTATDMSQGVRFSLQERGSTNTLLIDAALPWEPPFPSVGNEIRGFARMRLGASAQRVTGIEITEWHITWCEPPAPTQVRRNVGTTDAVGIGTSDPEDAHEFALVDEDGTEGSNPTDDDVVDCHQGQSPSVSGQLWSPYDLVAQSRGIADVEGRPRGYFDGAEAIRPEPAGSVGVYFSLDGTTLCADAILGEPVTFYVLVRVSGPTECGITGSEFRIATIPAGWFGTGSPPPGSVILGDPLDAVGCNIAFHACTNASPVLLFTGIFLPSSSVSNYPLVVEKRNPSLNPNFRCPLVTLCDAPSYTIVCVDQGRPAYFNRDPKTPCGTSRIDTYTWTSLKRLYE